MYIILELYMIYTYRQNRLSSGLNKVTKKVIVVVCAVKLFLNKIFSERKSIISQTNKKTVVILFLLWRTNTILFAVLGTRHHNTNTLRTKRYHSIDSLQRFISRKINACTRIVRLKSLSVEKKRPVARRSSA